MPEKFDPYHRWLAIPPHEQPPHHYRLLGLAKFEADVDVIDSAADRQMGHVRTHQAGKYAEESQKLLNEIAAARLTLLDPQKKAAYDATLRPEETPIKKATPLVMAQPLDTASQPKSPTALPPKKLAPIAPASPSVAAPVRKLDASNLAPLLIAGGLVLLVLLLAGGAGAWLLFGSGDDDVVVIVDTQPQPVVPVDPPSPPVDPPIVTPAPVEPPVVNPENPIPPDDNPAVDDPVATPSPVDEIPSDDPTVDDPPAEDPPAVEPPRSPIAALFEPAEADTRAPPPDEATRKAKREQVEALFAVSAARSAAQRAEMAEKLIATAHDSESDPAAQFVLLDMAREVASGGGHVDLASEAIDELTDAFQVTGVALRAESLAQASPAVTQLEARKELVDTGIALVNELFAADKFAEAAKLIKSLQAVAVKARDKEQRATLAAQLDQGSELYKGFKEAQTAIETLKKTPDDAQAALVAGKYYAFIKGDWQRGLVMLSVSSDAALKKLAEQEMQQPQAKDECVALADGWLAHAASAKGLEAERQQARAAMWYRKVQSSLIGLAKIEVQRKLDGLGKLAVDGGTPFTPSIDETAMAVQPASDPLRKVRGLIHHWPFDESRGITAKDVIGGNDFVLSGYRTDQSPWSTGKVGGAAEFFGGASLAATKRPITREQYTIAFWLKTGRSTGTNPRIIFPIDGAYNWIMLNAENRLGVGFYYDRGSNPVQVRQPPMEGAWEHYAIAIDLTKGDAGIYRNGELAVRGAFRDKLPRGSWMLAHNSDPRNHTDSFAGQIDDLRVYERVLSADEVRQLSATETGDEAKEPPSAESSDTIDLLALIDVRRDAVVGDFRRVETNLLCPPSGWNKVHIPFVPPATYVIEVEATRKGPAGSGGDLAVGLVYQGKQIAALIDSGNGSDSSFRAEDFGGGVVQFSQVRHPEGSKLRSGRRQKVTYTVEADRMSVAVDGREILQYSGKPTWRGLEPGWSIRDTKSLMIGAYYEPFEIHSIKLTTTAPSKAPQSYRQAIYTVGDKPGSLHPVTWVDGPFSAVVAHGKSTLKASGNYIYFKVDDSFLHDLPKSDDPIELTASVFDGVAGWISVQFDAHDEVWKSAPLQRVTGSGKWIDLTFDLSGARLANRQNGGADIRIMTGSNNLVLHKLVMRHAAPANAATDLLKLVDTKKNSVLGEWRLVDGELISPRHADAMRLQIPTKLPAEYDLDLEVTRNGGGNELAIGMIYQGKQCSVGIDRFSARSTDIMAETIGGRPEVAVAAVANLLKAGERSRVKCQVRKGSLTVLVNDKEIVAYRGDANWSGMISGWAVPDKQALMVGAWWAEFRIHSFTLTPLAVAASNDGGEATSGRRELLELVDPKTDAIAGVWRFDDGVLASPPDAEASLRVPYIPAREYDLDFAVALGDTNVDLELKLPYGGAVLTLKIDSGPDVKVGVVRNFRCAVRKTGIMFYQNGKLASKIDRDPVAKPMRDNDDPFAIVTRGTLAQVSKFTLTELSGEGSQLRKATGAAAIDGGIYLDDLAEVSWSAHGPPGKHGKTGLGGHLNPIGDAEPAEVIVGGRRYAHALFAAVKSENFTSSVVYDIAGKYARFTATAGVNDKAHSFTFSGPMKLQVIGDGKVLWTSEAFTAHGQTAAVDVSVAGVRRLEMKANCPTGNAACAWAVWLEPKLTP